MNFLSNKATNIAPYTAGEQPAGRTYIKLNANENPYPPSPAVTKALESFSVDRLKFYPSMQSVTLKETIARVEGVSPKNVFCGNGSDEVLALSYAAFFDPEGLGACFPNLTYSFYPVYAQFFGIPTVIAPLNEDFTMNLKEMAKTPCQGYYIANPNAPTSVGIPLKEMEEFIASVPEKIVIADEAYMDFYGQSCVKLTKKYENLLVVKTFSKSYSLAGIRCGYAVGNEALIEGLYRMKDSFNSYPVDSVCECVCAAAIQDRAYFQEKIALVQSERERLRKELMQMGFYVLESKTNFLFAGRGKKSAKEVYQRLKEEGVLVRFWDKPLLSEFCRITVGTKEENDVLIEKLNKIL